MAEATVVTLLTGVRVVMALLTGVSVVMALLTGVRVVMACVVEAETDGTRLVVGTGEDETTKLLLVDVDDVVLEDAVEGTADVALLTVELEELDNEVEELRMVDVGEAIADDEDATRGESWNRPRRLFPPQNSDYTRVSGQHDTHKDGGLPGCLGTSCCTLSEEPE